MPAEPLPPVAVAISFVDCINRGDVEGLGALMTDDHALAPFDETPLVGRDANVEAWHGYCTSYPQYVIHPHRLVVDEDSVVILGHTTGSHLERPDDEEATETLIWIAVVRDGRVLEWRLVVDEPANRERWHLT